MALDFLVTSLSLSSTFLLLNGFSLHFPKWEFEKKKKNPREITGRLRISLRWQRRKRVRIAKDKLLFSRLEGGELADPYGLTCLSPGTCLSLLLDLRIGSASHSSVSEPHA